MRDSEATIGRALASVAYQTLQPEKVIVVDNLSTDNSVTEARRWENKLPMTVIRCSTPGSAAARNAGILAGGAELFAFLDADDIWYPNKLSAQIEYMSQQKCQMSGTRHHYLSASGNVLGKTPPIKPSRAARLLEAAKAMPVPISSAVLSSELIREVGLLDETFLCAQDFEWFVRLSRRAKLAIVPGPPLMGYTISSKSTTATAYKEQALAADLVRMRRLTGNWGLSYRENVIDRVKSNKIPRRIRAAQLFRSSGVSWAEGQRLRALIEGLGAVFLDGKGAVRKTFKYRLGMGKAEVPKIAATLFKEMR